MPRRRVWVVFNGEIYNFKELRAELEQRGHRLPTRSDTEVIVHGYKEWGTDVFGRLNGMFGLAIWDVSARAARRGARRDGHQARLLPERRRTADVRIGNPRGPGRRRASARRRSGRAQPVPEVPLHAVAADDLQRRPQARAGHDAGRRERRVPRGALVRLHARPVSERARTTRRRPANCSISTRARSSGICSAMCRSASCSAADSTPACCWR